MTPELLEAYSEELLPELTRTTIRLLYPYFNPSETLEDAKLLLTSLKLPLSMHYALLFTTEYEHIVQGKQKAELQRP